MGDDSGISSGETMDVSGGEVSVLLGDSGVGMDKRTSVIDLYIYIRIFLFIHTNCTLINGLTLFRGKRILWHNYHNFPEWWQLKHVDGDQISNDGEEDESSEQQFVPVSMVSSIRRPAPPLVM